MLPNDDPNLYLRPDRPEAPFAAAIPLLQFKLKKYAVLKVPVVTVVPCQCPSCKHNYGIE